MNTKEEQAIIEQFRDFPDQVQDRLANILQQDRSMEICMAAIEIDPWSFPLVPEVNMTEDLLKLAIEKRGANLEYIPTDKITGELYRYAIEHSAHNIHYIPENHQEINLWKRVIEKTAPIQEGHNIWVLTLNPYPELTLSVLQQIGIPEARYNNGGNFDELFRLIPKDLLTDEAVEFALRQDVRCYRHLPEEMKTRPRSIYAVSQNGLLLDDVPERMKDKNMCLLAVKNIGLAYDSIPEQMKTDEFNWQCVKENPSVIYEIEEGKRTRDMCQTVILSGDHHLCRYIPYPDLALKFLEIMNDRKEIPVLYHQLHEGILNKEMAAYLIREQPEHFNILPSAVREDRELCRLAVEKRAGNLMFIPDKFKTATLCLEAVSRDPAAILGILPELKTQENYRQFVKKDPAALQFVPNGYKDFDMCQGVMLDVSFGRNDINYFAHITDTNLLSNGIYFYPDPKVIPDILNTIPLNRMNENIARSAIEKNARSVFNLPKEVCTLPMLELAIQKDPTLFKELPDHYKHPDICLLAVLHTPAMGKYIPDTVLKEKNILSFLVALIGQTKDQFTYEQFKQIYYKAEPFTLKTDVNGKKLPANVVQFTEEKGLHRISPEKQQKKSKQQKKPPKPRF